MTSERTPRVAHPSEYLDYEVNARREDDGQIVLSQTSGHEESDVILLTPDQLVRLGEWAKSWAKREGRG